MIHYRDYTGNIVVRHLAPMIHDWGFEGILEALHTMAEQNLESKEHDYDEKREWARKEKALRRACEDFKL